MIVTVSEFIRFCERSSACRSADRSFDYRLIAILIGGLIAMQYMLLIYHNEANRMPPKEESAMMQEYMTFTQDIVKNGKFKAGDRLEPTANATTVRVRNGKTATVDGPFAETKEQLRGYYLVEAKDLDEAIAIAAKIPRAKHGSIEVRPVFQMNR